MAGFKGSTELMKTERPRLLSPIDEMERWFEDVIRRPFSWLPSTVWPEMKVGEFEAVSPHVDIYEEGNELVLKADLPGLEKKDLDISVSGNALTITGEKKREEKVEKGDYFRYERSHGSFFRRFELPADVDTEKIEAHLENGVLEVRLPKSEEAKSKSKKISIS
ncbi:MAG TPA: Hsp20/alpha crystallin family protein [Thermodesulfovibrionales bacterium]|nr:Hsp20/alpha crystallin family protein [Thermodesulfovibrionales bacterium]